MSIEKDVATLMAEAVSLRLIADAQERHGLSGQYERNRAVAIDHVLAELERLQKLNEHPLTLGLNQWVDCRECGGSGVIKVSSA